MGTKMTMTTGQLLAQKLSQPEPQPLLNHLYMNSFNSCNSHKYNIYYYSRFRFSTKTMTTPTATTAASKATTLITAMQVQ